MGASAGFWILEFWILDWGDRTEENCDREMGRSPRIAKSYTRK
ncbi:MAG: hypothetical protein AAFX78_16740 [Cyanobacteria bacterium J06638_20]